MRRAVRGWRELMPAGAGCAGKVSRSWYIAVQVHRRPVDQSKVVLRPASVYICRTAPMTTPKTQSGMCRTRCPQCKCTHQREWHKLKKRPSPTEQRKNGFSLWSPVRQASESKVGLNLPRWPELHDDHHIQSGAMGDGGLLSCESGRVAGKNRVEKRKRAS